MLFPIAKMWELPKCPSTDEWIKMMWYIIYNGKYSAIKKEQNSAICSYLDATGNVAKKKKKTPKQILLRYNSLTK